VEQPASFESRCDAGLVYPRDARMGLQLHGGSCPHPHGAGLPLRSVQISARAYLDRRCFSLLMTLGMAFTGQVLRFDQDAYWGLGIGASIASRVPIAGPIIVKLMLGGPIIAGATLSRFFALHVFVIPGMLIGFVCLHLLMVLKLGINEWPMPGRLVKRATYENEYHQLTRKDGAPFVPYAVWKDLFFAAFILLAVAACAQYFGPFGPTARPDPTVIQTAPKPDYFFFVAVRFAFLLAAFNGDASSPHWPRSRYRVLGFAAISFWRRGKELAPAADRCFDGSADCHSPGTLTHLAGYTPWSPHMNAWSGDPVPGQIFAWQHRASATRCTGFPGQAVS